MAYLLLQNGTDKLQLQDASGNLLLQEAVGVIVRIWELAAVAFNSGVAGRVHEIGPA